MEVRSRFELVWNELPTFFDHTDGALWGQLMGLGLSAPTPRIYTHSAQRYTSLRTPRPMCRVPRGAS